MPFQSDKQRRYLWANEPEIARDWTDRYGARGGGIMRVPLADGSLTIIGQNTPDAAEYFPEDVFAGTRRAMTQPNLNIQLEPYDPNIPQELQFWDGQPFTAQRYDPYSNVGGNKTKDMQADVQVAKQLANLDKFVGPHDPSVFDKWGNRRMALEKEDFYEAPSGLASLMKGFKTKTGEGWDFAKQLPGMAMSALSGIPGLGFLLNAVRSSPIDKYNRARWSVHGKGLPGTRHVSSVAPMKYYNTLRHGNLTGQDPFGINTVSMFGNYNKHYQNYINKMNKKIAGGYVPKGFQKDKYDFAQEVTGTKKTSPNITGTPLITSTSIHQGPDTPQGGNWGAAPGTPGAWSPGARDGGRMARGGIASLWRRQYRL